MMHFLFTIALAVGAVEGGDRVGTIWRISLPLGPSNDNCESAMPVGDVVGESFDTTDAAFDGGGTCLSGPNIWYCYTAPRTGMATISLCGSSYDTMLAVYDGCACETLSLIACNDDACGMQSEITFAATAGQEYLIEVGGYYGAVGAGVLSIATEAGPAGACCNPDGSCVELSQAECSGQWLGAETTCEPHLCPQPGACCSPDGSCTVTLESDCAGDWLGVGTDCDPSPCPQPTGACCDPDDSCVELPQVECAGQWLGAGTTCDPNPCGAMPPNDNCADAMPVGDVASLPFDTATATADGNGTCLTGPNIWYCYTAPRTAMVTISLCGSLYDTMLAVYDGCACDTLSQIACNDDACGMQSEITFAATAGQEYLIEIGGYFGAVGTGVLNISPADRR